MAKQSVVNRNEKRKRAVLRLKTKRAMLKKTWLDLALPEKQRQEAFILLQKMPRDSAVVRTRNRCAFTGRPRGVYRRFGISRTMLRDMIMNGEVPGVTKSSW